MAHFFYTDVDGQEQGPINKEQLKELAANGTIAATTILKSDGGHTANASAWFPGLKFKPVTQQTSPDCAGNQSEQSEYLFNAPGLFDIGFTRFITNTWTSILWVLTIILALLGCGGAMVSGASNNAPALFIIAPIAAALFLLFMRMLFELTIVIFRIETHLRTIRDKYENK